MNGCLTCHLLLLSILRRVSSGEQTWYLIRASWRSSRTLNTSSSSLAWLIGCCHSGFSDNERSCPSMPLEMLGRGQRQMKRGDRSIPYQFITAPLVCDVRWTRIEKHFRCGYAREKDLDFVPGSNRPLKICSPKVNPKQENIGEPCDWQKRQGWPLEQL